MKKLENIKMLNDLVLRTERGEISWSKTKYAGVYQLNNSNGLIEISKSSTGNVLFKIIGSEGEVVSLDTYFKGRDEDLQMYKVSNVLWMLVKDLSSESKVDFQEILDLLEEEDKTDPI